MYGDSQTASTNSSPAFNSYPKLKTLETMDSFVDLHGYRQFRNNQTVSGSGLLRFRSAPSYLFSNFENEVSNSGDSNRESVGLNLNPTIAGDFGSRCFEDMEEDDKSLVSRYCLNSQLPPQYPRRNTASQASTMADSYRVVASTGLNIPGQARTGSNHLTVPNAYSSVRSIESYQVGDDLTSFSTRFKDQTNYPSRIYENGSEHFCSWNDSSPFSRNFNSPKSEFGNQSLMISNNMPMLSKNSVAEIAVMEKLLQFQDSVPCKIRAKRGCATHPRSIAERVRRTRISERIRKLQEIVPNMEKQTSTADMLELAVEYIKELQKQYKVLSDYKANCKCSSILKP